MFPASFHENHVTKRISDFAKYVQSSTSSRELTPLPLDFIPGRHDVICARGKVGCNHTGNRRYHLVIEMHLQQYSKATSKVEKSLIMSSITDLIKESSPKAGFIKKEKGRWYIVGDHAAREKVGQSLRNSLHTKYSSSTKAKKQRREAAMRLINRPISNKVETLRETNLEESNISLPLAVDNGKIQHGIASITCDAKQAGTNIDRSFKPRHDGESCLGIWCAGYPKNSNLKETGVCMKSKKSSISALHGATCANDSLANVRLALGSCGDDLTETASYFAESEEDLEFEDNALNITSTNLPNSSSSQALYIDDIFNNSQNESWF